MYAVYQSDTKRGPKCVLKHNSTLACPVKVYSVKDLTGYPASFSLHVAGLQRNRFTQRILTYLSKCLHSKQRNILKFMQAVQKWFSNINYWHQR